jgi:hypothetical protein
MAYFIALGILSLVGIVGTVWLVRTDGYGRIPTDPSRAAASADRPDRPAQVTAAVRTVEAARPTTHFSATPAAPVTGSLRIARAK